MTGWWRRRLEVQLAGLVAKRSRIVELINSLKDFPGDFVYRLLDLEEEIGRLEKRLEK